MARPPLRPARVPSVLTAVLAALLVAVAAAPAGAALRFSSSGCPGNFSCARLVVPLDRSGAVPGSVRLSIERLRGTRDRRATGRGVRPRGRAGPGRVERHRGFNSDTFGAIGGRDLVVVDQRGTGRSGALACPALERPGDDPIDARTASCAERLGAARGLYTTEDTVADLEAVRAALGVPRITLLGVSYGTKVALAYARRHPERVERLVLDSVVDVEGQDPFDLDTFAALPRVLAELCRGECARVTRDLPGDVAALADRMRAAPLRGPLIDRRGRTRTRSVTARDLYQRIRAGDAIPALRVDYPGAIRAALEGDPAPLVRLEHAGREGLPEDPEPEPGQDDLQAQTQSFTLQAATLCEEAPLPWDRFASPAERDRQARERALAIPDAAFEPFDREVALAPDSNNLLFQCRRWPTTALRAAAAPAGFPDVPVLVLTGREDVRTPVEVAVRVARAFPRAQVVEVPKTGHAVLAGAPCARDRARALLRRPPPRRPVRRDPPLAPCRADPAREAGPRAPGAGHRGHAGPDARRRRAHLRDLQRQGPFGSGGGGGGLRAGTYAQRRDGDGYDLRGFSFVPGVTVTGRLTGAGRLTGRLRVGGSAAARGTLTLTRAGELTGRLGGRPVRTRYRPPRFG
jgi:pimeloyl-ACP methyl ester carboxylesterase